MLILNSYFGEILGECVPENIPDWWISILCYIASISDIIVLLAVMLMHSWCKIKTQKNVYWMETERRIVFDHTNWITRWQLFWVVFLNSFWHSYFTLASSCKAFTIGGASEQYAQMLCIAYYIWMEMKTKIANKNSVIQMQTLWNCLKMNLKRNWSFLWFYLIDLLIL